jgi:cold shock CspA family protein/MoxR-like ATPase
VSRYHAGDSEIDRRINGTVKWWNEGRGYGFITADDGADLFVHVTALEMNGGNKALAEGARVAFNTAQGPQGPMAVNVVEEGNAPIQEVDPEPELTSKIRRVLKRRSYRSRAGLRADVVPGMGVDRARFHRCFEEAVDSLERDGTIKEWPTFVEWSRKQVPRGAVLRAIAEFDRHGRDETLQLHGFRRALDYVVVYEGKEYDSKALYAIAYGLHYPHDPPLRDQQGFSGGVHVTRKLEREGFKIKRLRAQADAALAREGARAWIVRAGQRGENEDLARDENIVLIGWSELGELGPDITRAQLKSLIRATGEERDASVNAQAGSIYRFINEMQEGDLVVLPLQRDRGKASVGIIDGPFIYRPDGIFQFRDAHYQRPVTWLTWALPYELFDPDLRDAFGAQGTVSEIRREKTVERILESTKDAPSSPRSEEAEDEPQGKAEPKPNQAPHPPRTEEAATENRAPYVELPLSAIAEAVQAAGLSITERMLRRYHFALRTRGFVILAGISGGGKTWLAETYAAATGAELLVAPVAPNWTTNEDLLGYLNPIDGRYCHTPFSRFLIRAAREYEEARASGGVPRPYHLVLDEMNLARVEHYFAKFLSAMEARERNGTCPIHLSPQLTVELTPNLHVIGTVNVDETTYGFADKIFDRAQLLELEVPREALHTHIDGRDYRDALMSIWDVIRPIAPFGFRVLDEVDAYVTEAVAHGASWEEALDDQLLQKVLPKIKGTDPKLAGVLEQLEEATREDFPLSQDKVRNMRSDFTMHGFVSFF